MRQPSSRNELIERANAAVADAFSIRAAASDFANAAAHIPGVAELPSYRKLLAVLGRELAETMPNEPE